MMEAVRRAGIELVEAPAGEDGTMPGATPLVAARP
jgi:hypothetical protein